MIDWKEHRELQHALQVYTAAHSIILTGNEEYESGIDCVIVYMEDDPVFIIGLPPVSNYHVKETDHTNNHYR